MGVTLIIKEERFEELALIYSGTHIILWKVSNQSY